MKKTKALIATLAAAVLGTSVLGLAACQKDGNTEPDTPVTPDTPASTTYTITFDANGGAFADEKTTTTVTATNGKISALPTAPTYADHTFSKWTVNKDGTGGDVTATYNFTAATTVYAQWTVDSNDNDDDDDDDDDGDDDNGNDTLEAGDYNLYVNDILVNNSLSAGTGGAATAPANLVFNYYAENVTLNTGDTVKFVIKDKTISKIWAEGGTAIQGVTGTQSNQGADITGDTVTVLAGGTYTVSVTQWQDQVEQNKVSVYIGPYTGSYN